MTTKNTTSEWKNPHELEAKPTPLDGAACCASFEYEWLNHGYTFKNAVKAKNAYESWAGEEVSYEDVNYAITGRNKRSGLFWERITAFFAGFMLRNPKE